MGSLSCQWLAQQQSGAILGQRNFIIGIVSAVAVFCIWSGFFVISRMGVTTALTPFDLAALRFMVAGVVTLPFVYWWWPRGLAWWVIPLLVVCGPGSVYTLILYYGLQNAPAAYAGVFANGSIPIATMLLAAIIAKDYPGPWRLLGIAVLYLGGTMVGLRGLGAGGADVGQAILIFVGSSLLVSTYIYGISRWALTPWNALAIINVPNLLIYLPIWYLFLPSGIDQATVPEIATQVAFQGLGPGFFALIFFTLAATHLGASATSGFSAAVPAGVAVLAIPVLGEVPTVFEWVGIGLVTVGLAILVLRKRT